jgi:hypothetical protein
MRAEAQSTSRNGIVETMEVRVTGLATPSLSYTITPQPFAC